jgi:hypothetical protein
LLTSTKAPVLQVPGPGWALLYHEYHRRMLLVPIHFKKDRQNSEPIDWEIDTQYEVASGVGAIREDRQNSKPIDWEIDTQYEVASGVGVWISPGATFIAPDLV